VAAMNAPEKEPAAALELRAKPPQVTRLNRKVVAILLIVIGLLVLLAFAWGLRKGAAKAIEMAPEIHHAQTVAKAEGLASLPKDYSGVPHLGPPTGEFGNAIVAAEKQAGVAPLPDRADFHPSAEEEVLRAERMKEMKDAEEAIRASVMTPLKNRGSRAPASLATGASASAYRDPDSDGFKRLSLSAAPHAEDPASQTAKQAFIDKDVDPKTTATGRLQTPLSPYQLMAGAVIPAALITGIQSDLPGQVIASVTENVFDTVTGAHLLIPQGARLIGQYDSQIAWGQNRVLLVWTRLIRPDGSSIVLDRLSGVDESGYAGLQDGVDWHWRRIFAGAALSTVLGAGAELAAPNRSNGEGQVVIATRESIEDTVNQVGQELTRRNLQIQPTLTERPGLPVKILVNKDLVFPSAYGKESE